jgi:hypothetical protein
MALPAGAPHGAAGAPVALVFLADPSVTRHALGVGIRWIVCTLPQGLPNCLKDEPAAKLNGNAGSENQTESEEQSHILVAFFAPKPLAWALETV